MQKLQGKVKPQVKLDSKLTKSTRTVSFSRKVEGGMVGRGVRRVDKGEAFTQEMEKMECPMVWIYYPWRANPEPPYPLPPGPTTMKNLHHAVWTDLSPKQKQLQDSFFYGLGLNPGRQKEFEEKHPLLNNLNQDLKGEVKGFPFWYKKYPTKYHAYATRFNVPHEMLEGYSSRVKALFSSKAMSEAEKLRAEKHSYSERYARHPLDQTSLSVQTVKYALLVRQARNHLIHNRHNTVMKIRLRQAESFLQESLRRLRKLDFKRYWEIVKDHDCMEFIQPNNHVSYRWGTYWMYDWNSGCTMRTDLSDFMDPRGMNGCIETGRSRAEVARDLGLSYTRTLKHRNKMVLLDNALSRERYLKFKNEQPEQWKLSKTRSLTNFLTSMHARPNTFALANDFPSKHRYFIGTKYIRWKSKRHGPQ